MPVPNRILDFRDLLLRNLEDSLDRATRWLLQQQSHDGFWCAILEGDSILESEYILLQAFLGKLNGEHIEAAAKALELSQAAHGGWSLYPGGPIEISASVKAYFALKLAGRSPELSHLCRAREAIRQAGGADGVNSFTRFYLALLGQIDYRFCPAVPPEAVLLPKWFPVNMYRISAWSRTMLVPLAIMWAHRPVREIPAAAGIHELMLQPPSMWPRLRSPALPPKQKFLSWETFFRWSDRFVKLLDRNRIRPLRQLALRRAEKWMVDRFANSDGLGAIYPPIVWSRIALDCLGYADASSEVKYCDQQLADLIYRPQNAAHIRIQPCKSPVWDTGLAIRALDAAKLNQSDPHLQIATDWLLGKQVTRNGDWSERTRVEPGGWYFEFRNEFYPDIDDTIMALMALRTQIPENGLMNIQPLALASGSYGAFDAAASPEASANGSPEASANGSPEASVSGLPEASANGWPPARAGRPRLGRFERIRFAVSRGLKWVLALQNSDGGWGAFDRDNDAEFLCSVPFADHNAMIDPSTPDITARVLEAIGQWGWTQSQSEVQKAIEFLRRTQESDGSWFGRWGVNHIYGTWQVLVGLRAMSLPASDSMIERGARWLESVQQPSGGWGETPASYDNPAMRGCGHATASQTAWGILGLLAARGSTSSHVQRGIEFLLKTQNSDGTWNESEFTGTGFPRVFYLRYHLYPHYFPMLALGSFASAAGESEWKNQCENHRRFGPRMAIHRSAT